MLSSSDSEVPKGDLTGRSSTGIGGPSQIPVDDDEIDVSDATIVDLEDGFKFVGTTPLYANDLTERYEVFGRDAVGELPSEETPPAFLERNWLVDQGEA
jgi:hypothetical protein